MTFALLCSLRLVLCIFLGYAPHLEQWMIFTNDKAHIMYFHTRTWLLESERWNTNFSRQNVPTHGSHLHTNSQNTVITVNSEIINTSVSNWKSIFRPPWWLCRWSRSEWV